MQVSSFEEIIAQIVAQDPRYRRDAYCFVREALDHTQKSMARPRQGECRHVSGRELLDGIREYALRQFGPMTLAVLGEWHITRCEDFGEIVFNMVETRLLAKTEQDSPEDFKNAYDFHDAFRKPFLPAARVKDPLFVSKQG